MIEKKEPEKKIEVVGGEKKDEAQPSPQGDNLNQLAQYITFLEAMKVNKKTIDVAPTQIPKNFYDQIQFFDDGTSKGMYLFLNDNWVFFPDSSSMAGVNGRSSGSGVTVISGSTLTQVTMTNNFSNGITWNNTDKRFVVVTAGQYQINACIGWQTTTQDKSYFTMIYKNGVLNTYGLFKGSVGGNAQTLCVSDILDLQVGDYIELWCQHTHSSAQQIYNDPLLTYLSIAKV